MASPPSVLITGASKGIGEATARLLDARGFTVFAGVRASEDGERLRRRASERLTPVHLDITDSAAVAAVGEELRDRLAGHGLDGLVNNAGIVVAGPLEFLPLAALRTQFEVNVIGVMAVTQAVLPLLRIARGRIVNVSSVNGRVAVPFTVPYAASKFALEAFSDGLRLELARWGMHTVVIEPGAIETAIWDTARALARKLMQAYPDDATRLYGGVFRRLRTDRGAPKHALPPEHVARTIVRALTARRPRARYRVGLDAKLGAAAARLLPAGVLDRLIAGQTRRVVPPEPHGS